MKKANVEKMETLAAGYLQHCFKQYQTCKNEYGELDIVTRLYWSQYDGACKMIAAMGACWERIYSGHQIETELNDINFYSHAVYLPDDKKCDHLNMKAWED